MAKKNYGYGKIENGVLQYAPNKLVEGDAQIFNASAAQYSAQGWLPVVRTQQPEQHTGGYWSPEYSVVNGKIVQNWTFNEYQTQPESPEAIE